MHTPNQTEVRKDFEAAYQRKPERAFFACGRVELLGNHTDHQNGVVLTAAVDRYIVAETAIGQADAVTLVSNGFSDCHVSLGDVAPRKEERFTTQGLVRGAVAKLLPYAKSRTGVQLAVRSEVPSGSGLSSSAAFSVLLLTALNAVWEAGRTPLQLAGLAREAERDYFGKPCGWMDPSAIALGGVRYLDFSEPVPKEEELPPCLSQMGLSMVVLDVGIPHADMTAQYAAIVDELSCVSCFFGKQTLSEVEEAAFYRSLPAVRLSCGDRAVLRAMHVFSENRRVREAKEALIRGDREAFLERIRASGASSMRWLQNVEPTLGGTTQPLTVALSVLERLLQNEGAVRIHGGGFGGTILCLTNETRAETLLTEAKALLGADGMILHPVSVGAGEFGKEKV